ncbi:hypothetical protein F0231_20580 [Vibrio sp. RE86]|nr:hypothetical protein [Vibrio sp. RE86]
MRNAWRFHFESAVVFMAQWFSLVVALLTT